MICQIMRKVGRGSASLACSLQRSTYSDREASLMRATTLPNTHIIIVIMDHNLLEEKSLSNSRHVVETLARTFKKSRFEKKNFLHPVITILRRKKIESDEWIIIVKKKKEGGENGTHLPRQFVAVVQSRDAVRTCFLARGGDEVEVAATISEAPPVARAHPSHQSIRALL